MIIGLTGSLGTGKSTVARMLRKKGAHIIDADKIVHSLINEKLRREIGKRVFDNKAALRKLCKVIHPLVIKEIFSEIKCRIAKKIIIIDAPLLIEAGLHKKCDRLVVVKSDLAVQLERASRRLKISRSDCIKRIRSQMPLNKKVALADFVIDNSGTINSTLKQVEDLWKKLYLWQGRK